MQAVDYANQINYTIQKKVLQKTYFEGDAYSIFQSIFLLLYAIRILAEHDNFQHLLDKLVFVLIRL